MFVFNCQINEQEELKYPKGEEESKRKFKKNKKPIANDSTIEYDVYKPVECINCNTGVGVYDSNEIYHFFNVLASHS